jgi:hypothetical protein
MLNSIRFFSLVTCILLLLDTSIVAQEKEGKMGEVARSAASDTHVYTIIVSEDSAQKKVLWQEKQLLVSPELSELGLLVFSTRKTEKLTVIDKPIYVSVMMDDFPIPICPPIRIIPPRKKEMIPVDKILIQRTCCKGKHCCPLDEAYDYPTPGSGRIIIADAGPVEIEGTDGIIVSGVHGNGYAAPAIPGSRMFFNPRKSAFRVGYVGYPDLWKDANIGEYSTIAGGMNNQATGLQSTVSGGGDNVASADASVVAGGRSNKATDSFCFVGSGYFNEASNRASFVGSGYNNKAGGSCSAVPGGKLNEALGDFSFAAGYRAKIRRHNSQGQPLVGSFVWADANDCDFVSDRDNEFAIRAIGGVRFISSLSECNPSNGVELAPGSGSWSTMSDEAMKENLTTVEGQLVLNKILSLPIHEWNYKSQDPSIRHVGPTAQDFYDAFGLGEADKYISNVDVDGIALAAIKALAQKTNELNAKLAEISELKAQLEKLQKEVLRNSRATDSE